MEITGPYLNQNSSERPGIRITGVQTTEKPKFVTSRFQHFNYSSHTSFAALRKAKSQFINV